MSGSIRCLLLYADTDDFIVYSKVTAIEYLSIRVTNATQKPPYDPLQNNMTKNVIALATDSDRKRIYFSDIQRHAVSWATYDGKVGDILQSKFSLLHI